MDIPQPRVTAALLPGLFGTFSLSLWVWGMLGLNAELRQPCSAMTALAALVTVWVAETYSGYRRTA